MADEEDSEPEVFEITDFTTASEWERFIAKLEEAIRSWKLDKSHREDSLKKTSSSSSDKQDKQPGTKSPRTTTSTSTKQSHEGDWNIQSCQLAFADFNFTLSHHALQSMEDETEISKRNEHSKKTEGQDSSDNPPASMIDMLDFDFDFPPRAHCLARWNGLKAFMVLSPSNPKEDIDTESRSKLLLSSVAVALSNTNCDIPMFVQVQQRWRRLFFGILLGNGFRTSFEMAHMRKTPPQCQNLSGLLDVFKSKLAVPQRLIPPVTMSVRFTYILNWPEDEWVQEPPDIASGFGEQIGYLNLMRLPFGPLQDPISELHLATSWPCLSEETIVDDNDFSDLNPIEAPKWSLRARSAENCTSLLYDHLLSFLHICKNSESTQQIIRSLSRDELDLDSYGDITQAFEKLTETSPRLSQSKPSSSSRPNKREQMKLRESPLPEELLNEILTHLFPDSHEEMDHAEERQNLLAEEQKKIEVESKKEDVKPEVLKYRPSLRGLCIKTEGFIFSYTATKPISDRFRAIKSAPEKSLVSLLTIALCIVNYGYGGVKAFAHLWHEFILEMRYRYENNILIPRMAVGPPDLGYCLIHQKLKMLNYCIQRKKDHHERSSKPINKASSAILLHAKKTDQDTDVDKETFESHPDKSPSWEVEDVEMDSESDDEFFEAREEQGAASEKLSDAEVVREKSASPDNDGPNEDESPSGSFLSLDKSSSSLSFEGRGVLKETEMMLLETDQPLCIPITQEQPPVTEDILEEQTQIILSLGKSEGGSKYLAQMQSASLYSDVQAFKAANPGCIFEDFVRWYSPNDWILGPETKQEKEDLAKMKFCLQKESEKAELKEVVGAEEIDGWDLDAEEQLTEDDLLQLEIENDEDDKPKWADEGHLSVRMRIPGNIWTETWYSAKPVPARRQKRLFDDTKEAEKVLHFLANLKLSEIVTYLFPVCVHSAINRISLENESSRPRISNILSQVIHETSRLGSSSKDETSKMMSISRQLQIAELAISRIKFLEKRFLQLGRKKEGEALDADVAEFVSQLLSKPEVDINGGPRGKIGKIVSKLIENDQQSLIPSDGVEPAGKTLSEIIREPQKNKRLTFPPPAGREYILRTTVHKPRESSRPSPQRMFTVITPDEFRLAGAFSRDTTFI